MVIRSSILLTLVLAACSGSGFDGLSSKKSGGDKEAPPKDGEGETDTETPGDNDSVDVPVWVNAAYLTCAWDGVESATDAAVGCELKDDQGAKLEFASKTKVKWVVSRSDGAEPKAKIVGGGDNQAELRLVVAARDAAFISVEASLTQGSLKKAVASKWKEQLQGLDDGDLSKCFEESADIKLCFDALPAQPATPPPGTKPLSVHTVFVSSKTFLGDMGGAPGADKYCDALAEDAGLKGRKWAAILSTATENARKRVKISTPVYNAKVDGSGPQKVADTEDEFWSGSLNGQIKFDERGTQITNETAWTGTEEGGVISATGTCGNWVTALDQTTGMAGNPMSSNDWLDAGLVACSKEQHIYCIDGQ